MPEPTPDKKGLQIELGFVEFCAHWDYMILHMKEEYDMDITPLVELAYVTGYQQGFLDLKADIEEMQLKKKKL